MAEKKAGRPKGAQNKVGKDEKEFIKGLLGETQEEFHDAFIYYAKRSKENEEARKFFMSVRNDLSKMIVPKPVEVDTSLSDSQFERLIGLASKWSDDDID